MAAEIICDECGKRAPMVFYPDGQAGWQKPLAWFQRQDKEGIQDACSRECIEKISKETGKTGVVLPI